MILINNFSRRRKNTHAHSHYRATMDEWQDENSEVENKLQPSFQQVLSSSHNNHLHCAEKWVLPSASYRFCFAQKYKAKLPVDFGPLTDKIVDQLKSLNRAIFPG